MNNSKRKGKGKGKIIERDCGISFLLSEKKMGFDLTFKCGNNSVFDFMQYENSGCFRDNICNETTNICSMDGVNCENGWQHDFFGTLNYNCVVPTTLILVFFSIYCFACVILFGLLMNEASRSIQIAKKACLSGARMAFISFFLFAAYIEKGYGPVAWTIVVLQILGVVTRIDIILEIVLAPLMATLRKNYPRRKANILWSFNVLCFLPAFGGVYVARLQGIDEIHNIFVSYLQFCILFVAVINFIVVIIYLSKLINLISALLVEVKSNGSDSKRESLKIHLKRLIFVKKAVISFLVSVVILNFGFPLVFIIFNHAFGQYVVAAYLECLPLFISLITLIFLRRKSYLKPRKNTLVPSKGNNNPAVIQKVDIEKSSEINS